MSIETLNADVAVIGGGIAGMVAAGRVSEGGKRVVVLEACAEELYTCSSRLTGAVFHCALNDIQKDPDDLQRIIIDTCAPSNPKLARVVAEDTIRAVRWLQTQGVRFIRGSPDPWHAFVVAPPSLGLMGDGWKGRGGDVLLRTLEAKLKERGGTVRRASRARRLIVERDAVVGVEGDDFIVRASAVVIADGGFQMDAELLGKAITSAPDRIVQRSGRTGFGDGLRMAMEVGAAATDDMSGFYGHILSRDALTREEISLYPWLDELARVTIAVTSDGRRFCDEGLGGTYIANKMAGLPDPAGTTVVWDAVAWEGPGRNRFLSPNPTLDKVGATVHRSDSLEELARMAGLDVGGLLDEVARYNAAVETGDFSALTPMRTTTKFKPVAIRQAPFAAAPAASGITHTFGGIMVDEHTRALRQDGTPLVGLYAIGASCGGVDGGPKIGYVGGMSKGAATGLRAAEHIMAR